MTVSTALASGGDEPDHGYSARHLSVLEGLEAVRKRPGMYVGSTDSRGLMHCLWEIVDNAVDEALAGYCTQVEVVLCADGSVEVRDNGRGIPVDVEPRSGLTGIELVMTKLHAGGKFGGGSYASSGGLHGVGASVVNALSARLDVEVDRDGHTHAMSFRRGIPGVFAAEGPNAGFEPGSGLRQLRRVAKKVRGTRIRFWPDSQLFLPEATVAFGELCQRTRQSAFLVPGLTAIVRDERGEEVDEREYRYDGGISEFCADLAPDESVSEVLRLQGSEHFTETVPVLDEAGHMTPTKVDREVTVDVALRWGSGYDTVVRSFVNVIATPKGGTHLAGFERALVRTLNDQLANTKLVKASDDPVAKDDVLEGMTAVVTVRLPEPQFEGQTKEVLGTSAVSRIVNQVVAKELRQFFAQPGRGQKTQSRAVLEKVVAAAKARVAARQQRENQRRKSALENSALPTKLVDCRSDDVERNELFIVEGDSAMGCFTGDTQVALVEGRSLTFEQLAQDWERGVTHFGYATNEQGNVVVVPLREPRVTRRQAQLVEVVLDNGVALRCTPDHLMRLRDGSYARADALQSGDSLMPLYRRLTERGESPGEGYEMAWANGRMRWEHTHHLADSWNLRAGAAKISQGPVRHHVDFDKRNNDPRNLRRMGQQEHLDLHAAHGSATFKALWQDPDYRARKIAQLSDQLSRQWEDPAFRELSSYLSAERHGNPVFTEKLHGGFRQWYESLSDEERAALRQRLDGMQRQYWAEEVNRQAASERTARFWEANPGLRQDWSVMARRQWDDPELRKWRSVRTREEWVQPGARERHSEAVRAWHEANPEFATEHSARMRAYHAQPGFSEASANGLRNWRETTPAEEKSRLVRAGQRQTALRRLRDVLAETSEDVSAVYETRRRQQAPTSASYSTMLRWFDGDEAELYEAARNVNHTVAEVRLLDEQADVYDLTVDKYHNFALEAGIFVHNSAKTARESEFQALLPIRGKILNVQKASVSDTLKNAECASIIQVIGGGSGRSFDLDQVRYGKIIIMADADVDGAHIRCLLLTLFHRYMRPLLEEGRVFAAVPPLHRVETVGGRGKRGEYHYAYSDAEMRSMVDELTGKKKKIKEPIQRYKGLGEMDAHQLAETTMDPRRRMLRRVRADDAQQAAEVFDLLMGNSVAPRRDFIVGNANELDPTRIDT